MAININRQGDCAIDLRGTGLSACEDKFGDLISIGVVEKGWSKNIATDNFTETDYRTAVQDQVINPFRNIYTYTQDTPDTERATGNTGLMSDVRKGKPEYTFTFDEGACFHKNLYSFDGQNRWDLILFFETGIFLATNVAGTEIKGFDTGLFSVDTRKFQEGSDPNMSMVKTQFTGPVEFNTRNAFLSWDSLGFDANFINGVINAGLTYNVAPTATTTVQVRVTDECNTDIQILGLTDVNNWRLGGTQASSTTISGVTYTATLGDTPGFYTLTLSPTLASGDTIQPQLADVSGSQDVAENASGEFYKGTAPSATIA